MLQWLHLVHVELDFRHMQLRFFVKLQALRQMFFTLLLNNTPATQTLRPHQPV